MAKIPIILEAGRADGKLVTSDAIFDENKGIFQSEINDIQDTLTSDNSNKPLSAKQGKILKELLDTKVIEVGAVPIDTEPIEGNITHVVNSDGLAKEFNKHNTEIILGGVYDISSHNDNIVFESLSALLSSSDLDTLIPTSVRHGGMSIRFIQGSVSSSDNKYVQYRLMSATWSNIIADWQGVDDKPTIGSDNLVNSGGVAEKISELERKASNVGFYICNSSSESTIKEINIDGFEPSNKIRLIVKMNNSNSADNVIFSINGELEKPLYFNGGKRASSTNSWKANEYLDIFYYPEWNVFYAFTFAGLSRTDVAVLKNNDALWYMRSGIIDSDGKTILFKGSSTFFHTDYLLASEGLRLNKAHGFANAGFNYAFLYDKEFNLKSTLKVDSEKSIDFILSSIPEGVIYIRINAYLKDIESIEKAVCAIDVISNIESIESKSLQVHTSHNDFEVAGNGYCSKYGYIASNEQYRYTKPYLLKNGESIKVTSYDVSGENVARVVGANKNGQIISIIDLASKSTTTFEYTADKDIYLIFSYNASNGISVDTTRYSFNQVMQNSFGPMIKDLAEAPIYAHACQNILCIGDSLTAGAYFNEEWGEFAPAHRNIAQNYPNFVAKMINSNVVNGGVSGHSASTWWTQEISKYDLSQFDTFIIWLGTNNGLTNTLDTDVNPYSDYNDFAETETGFYCKIIAKIKEQTATKGSLIVLANVFASKGNVRVTNETISKIANKYNLPVVDMSDLNYMDKPSLHGYVNNVHFGKGGYLYVANRFINEINKFLKEDVARCEFGISARI